MSIDLMQQAKEFRQVYDLMDGSMSRVAQKKLIDEEWSEFHEAFHFMKEEEQLKELGDLVYVCLLSIHCYTATVLQLIHGKQKFKWW